MKINAYITSTVAGGKFVDVAVAFDRPLFIATFRTRVA
jgi:hypothetical protein